MKSTKFYVKAPDITEKRQRSGRLVPIFKSILQSNRKHEEYIERMIARDKQLNLG